MSNLRYFYIVCFVILIVLFLAIEFFTKFHVENKIIKPLAESAVQGAVDRFSDTLWYKYQRVFSYLPCEGRCPNTDGLQQELKSFSDSLRSNHIISFKIYSINGADLFDKDKSFFTSGVNEFDKKNFAQAQIGKKASNVNIKQIVDGKKYNVIKTLYPLLPLDQDKELQNYIVEVVYDISPIWGRSNRAQIIIMAIIISTFAIIFGVLYLMTHRAELLFNKQYEDNMELLKDKMSAEQDNKNKSQFLANISHELRTPLNAIIGFSEIIKNEVMGPIGNQQYKEYIHDIHTSGSHLLGLINDILDYSKADAGKLTVNFSDVDVTKIMQNCIRLVTPRANESGVKIIADMPRKHYVLHTDGKRLKQVLLNLFGNSVKFTPRNGTITLYAWNNIMENTFIIEVKDTGVGIAPKDISKVMATFGQVENNLSRKYEGTGLGLPLSNKLVNLMGGSLSISSEVDKGTTISVSLPYTATSDKEEAQINHLQGGDA